MLTTKTAKPKPAYALGDISVLYAAVLLRAAVAEGADAAGLAQRFRLDTQTLESAEARISIPHYMRLGHAAIAETGNRALGLRIGALSRPVDAGLAGLAGECAASAGAGLSTLVRYALLTSQNSRGLSEVQNATRKAVFYSIRPYNSYNCFVVDSVLAAWAQFLRTLTGDYGVLESVQIEYPSQGMDEMYESWFRCPVQFGAAENSLVVKADTWQQTPRQAQSAMHSALVRQCEQQLQQVQRGWTLQQQVQYCLTPLFQGETPALGTVAAKLGLTPWTLQRQLSAEGIKYKDLVDNTRQQLTVDYLRETRLSLAEVSWLLGFANPAAFHKAYKRWFAVSPGEHRKWLTDQRRTIRRPDRGWI